MSHRPLLKNIETKDAYSVCHARIRVLDVTLNLAKLTNSRKDEDDEPTNQRGVTIGPVAKEARETARKEFREGIKEHTHQIIGIPLFKLFKISDVSCTILSNIKQTRTLNILKCVHHLTIKLKYPISTLNKPIPNIIQPIIRFTEFEFFRQTDMQFFTKTDI